MRVAESPNNLSADEALPSRYVVGIDLGTTNSAVAYVDTSEARWRIRTFPIVQLTAPGMCEALEVLPSFHYEALPEEQRGGALRLPWSEEEAPRFAVGAWARDEGGRVPGRLIASAKSWLCHSGIDRKADILPWHAAADVERLSPVEVSARFLRHIRQAWNHAHRDDPLEQQDVVLTLPASFDEVARELTVEAARRAGLPRVVLIEEPQAAFYAWVYKHRDQWQRLVRPGQSILVCDVGGGTTDLTLIRVRSAEPSDGETLQFHRVAVGEHLLLGGDNLDVYLARWIEEQRVSGGQLDPARWDALLRQSRRAKEILLSDGAPDTWTVHIATPGSRLVAGAIQIELRRDEVRQLLVEGFLPAVSFDERPQRRRSGFQEFGLPYAPDPAITRYVAEFLHSHRHAGRDEPVHDDLLAARPDLILLNGGFFNASCLQRRFVEVLASWFAPCERNWRPVLLAHDKLHLAVANGAAYYGMVRRGEGVRIAAALARSYYVGVAADRPVAMCLVPGNAQPGSHYDLKDVTLQATIGQPVEFPLFVSSTRLVDAPGMLVDIQEEQLTRLPSIRTVLQASRRSESGSVPVTLSATITEIGTLELFCRQTDRDRSWRLEFDARAAVQTDAARERNLRRIAGCRRRNGGRSVLPGNWRRICRRGRGQASRPRGRFGSHHWPAAGPVAGYAAETVVGGVDGT
ncbi:MAG: hypothetical protein KatS3mg110_3854 [Pirellulaceae bacterium]|nr:MAG: hypothetical protein KatS3mg110_3854 [Pirellulaceae bacterium]